MVDSLTASPVQAADPRGDTKPDPTPVTHAAPAAGEPVRAPPRRTPPRPTPGAGELVRTQLRRPRPRDAVVGEEFGTSGHGARQWVIDPIDGTKNYVRGVPVWATLIALLDEGRPVLGVVSAPALGRRWWAATG